MPTVGLAWLHASRPHVVQSIERTGWRLHHTQHATPQAAILARLILSHAGGLLPTFYAPLFLIPAAAAAAGAATTPGSRGRGPARIGWPWAMALMCVPFCQSAVPLCVLLAASVTTLSSTLASEPVAVLFNSAALLFVLEVSN